jgi:hypothetical protein
MSPMKAIGRWRLTGGCASVAKPLPDVKQENRFQRLVYVGRIRRQ